ncbi:MAG: NAD(P)H-hydrate dehydratase [Dehalococcoidia bacterium]|nr:NAD(P)H-hydrate dehydratase [Dehalococcoidia bacterium]
MRALEAQTFAAGTTQAALMETAGRAVAVAVAERLGAVRARRILVLVGPGNNGGDGLVAARHLHGFGAEVVVYLLTRRNDDDSNLQAVRQLGIETLEASSDVTPAFDEALARADVVIDAVLGTGRQRPLEGVIASVFEKLKAQQAPLFAVDLPTGVDADSGAVDPHAASADMTLTLGFSKIGLHVLPGAAYAGEVKVLDIGLDPELGETVTTELLTRDWAQAALPERPAESNKGTYGRVLIVAGSASYTGAAVLSALGALRAGAGLVTIAAIAPVRAAAGALLPEATFLPLPEREGAIDEAAGDLIARALPAYDALLIGPGLGQAPGTQAVVRGLLTSPAVEPMPVVLDADALNALARQPGWQDEIRCRAVLTPHPGELARLMHSSAAEVQKERLAMARRCAAEWRQTVILKGAHTVIAHPDGQALISPFANALLATAGTGDVLAGAISGLMGQGIDPFSAAGLGVYLHGAAAEQYSEDYGPSGLLASELGAAIARAAARLRRGD